MEITSRLRAFFPLTNHFNIISKTMQKPWEIHQQPLPQCIADGNLKQSEMWEETYGRVVSGKERVGVGFQERAGHQSTVLNDLAFELHEYRKEAIGFAD